VLDYWSFLGKGGDVRAVQTGLRGFVVNTAGLSSYQNQRRYCGFEEDLATEQIVRRFKLVLRLGLTKRDFSEVPLIARFG
jgi:hypothetical protein